MGIAGSAVFAKFSRDDEREADSMAVLGLTRASIDPSGITHMLEILQRLDQTEPGKVEQWQLLTRARALDSTTFVVAAGQASPWSADIGGPGNAPTGVGHSAVISPRGEVLAELGPEPGLLIVELDLAAVAEIRRAIPVLANARF